MRTGLVSEGAHLVLGSEDLDGGLGYLPGAHESGGSEEMQAGARGA